jgi:hypothetical protein
MIKLFFSLGWKVVLVGYVVMLFLAATGRMG